MSEKVRFLTIDEMTKDCFSHICVKGCEKIKVTDIEVVVSGPTDNPYFEIKYREVGSNEYIYGYGSYNLNNVLGWKEEMFEVVKESGEESKSNMSETMSKMYDSFLNKSYR